jgi:hypothetical protein
MADFRASLALKVQKDPKAGRERLVLQGKGRQIPRSRGLHFSRSRI